MKPVTLWNKFDHDTKSYQFNHLEDGHSDREAPHAKFPAQTGWTGSKWTKEHAYLNLDNKVVRPFVTKW